MVTAPITLLVGKEVVLRDAAIQKIRTALFKDPSSIQFNEHIFDASQDPLTDLLTQSQTAPFLSEKRLLIVHQVDALKDNDRKTLLKHLKAPSSFSVWLLITDQKNTKASFLRQLADMADVKMCETPYKDYEVKSWLRQKIQERQKKIDPEAIEILFELVGKNMTALNHAVEQLALYVGERPSIERKDVEALLGESAEQNVFQLYEALKGKRLDTALKILNRLRGQGKRSHEIMASLVWQFDRMLRIKNMLNQGMGTADIASALRMHRFFAEQAVGQARQMKPENLKKDLKILLDCDQSIKRGSLREDLALERCVLSLNEV